MKKILALIAVIVVITCTIIFIGGNKKISTSTATVSEATHSIVQ